MAISQHAAYVTHLRSNGGPRNKLVELQTSCDAQDWRFSSLARVCKSRLPPRTLLTSERLEIFTHPLSWHWQDDVQNTQWQERLRAFTSVKDLVLFENLIEMIAPALQERSGDPEGVTDILPTLQNLFFRAPWPSKPIREIIKRFVAARQLSGRPIILHYWVNRCEGR